MKEKPNRKLLFLYRWIDSVIDPFRLLSMPGYIGFIKDWLKYSRMKEAEPIRLFDTYPCLRDKTMTTPFDRHYFYQDVWAFRRIFESKVGAHVDVGSRIDFVGMLTAVTHVAFVDLRPLEVNLDRLGSIKGTIMNLPYANNSVQSLSCLHVAEHIGLGRYGDPLDPLGTVKATQELFRVLAKGGNLYFSVPVGRPRLCFNAHRIFSPKEILRYFEGLELAECSAIDDDGLFREDIDPAILEVCDYACGLFWFKKAET